MNLAQKAINKFFPSWSLQKKIENTPNPRMIGFRGGQKSIVPSDIGSLFDILTFNGQTWLSIYQCINYYMTCAPLHNAIELVASQAMQFNPILVKKGDESEPVNEHEFLKLLRHPNPDTRTWGNFIKASVTYYLATGNCFFVAAGAAHKPALWLHVIRPQQVTITIGKDGYPEVYSISSKGYLDIDTTSAITFTRHVDKNNNFRFLSKDAEYEMYHIKNVNPASNSMLVYGMSVMQPLFYEIEQYLQSSIHNLSFLRRGAFPAGFFFFDSDLPMNDDQRLKLEEDVKAMYVGATNVGRTGLLTDGMKFQPMTMPHRDMAFMEMRKSTTEAIYNTLRIPLPIVSPEHMTFSNMSTAKLSLYDEAVIPVVDIIMDELFRFLGHRYSGTEGCTLSYDEGRILALEPRRNEQIKFMKESGIYTINEMRERAGSHAIDGGNVIYGVSMQSPIAVDQEDDRSLDDINITNAEMNAGINDKKPKEDIKPEKTEEEIEEEEDIKTLKFFCDTLEKQLNADGTPRYTKKEIYDIASKNGL
jgi:HK97 family phage portal protein